MSHAIHFSGAGAVSAGGWGVDALLALLDGGKPETSSLRRETNGRTIETPVLRVPAEGAPALKFGRLRRASPISKFAAAALLEAVGESRLAAIADGSLRVGVIFTMMNGCVNYSNRFFGEALADPSTASPILFPETVFNAPSSHLSAMIGSSAANDTLIGDSAGFATGIDLACEWIARGDVDGCVVLASEEIDWLSAEGLGFYSASYLPAEGAAAIYLDTDPSGVPLLRLPDPVSFAGCSREEAAARVREKLAVEDDGRTWLFDGRVGIASFDRPESLAWEDWQGPRSSPRQRFGEAMGASMALQTVAAVEFVRTGLAERAIVTTVGGNQQASGMLLGRP